MLTGKKEKKWTALNHITNVLWILISIPILVNTLSNARVLRNKMKKIETLASFLNAGCSDKYTVLPAGLYMHYYRQVFTAYAWLGLSVLIIVLVLANFMISAIYSRLRTMTQKHYNKQS